MTSNIIAVHILSPLAPYLIIRWTSNNSSVTQQCSSQWHNSENDM